jgi:HSP20 family protein
MTLSLWEPVETPLPLRDVMNQLLDSSFFGFGAPTARAQRLPIDVYETETQFVVEAALPGVKPADLEVTSKGNTITIHAVVRRGTLDQPEEATAKAKEEDKEKERVGTSVRRERFFGELTRTIELPGAVDVDKVEATYEHGLLTLWIPKTAHATPKRIPVYPKER